MSSLSPPSPRRRHYPELDGLRAIAILSVLVFHCLKVPLTDASRPFAAVFGACWFGVDLFFVLSGFLITGILLDTRNHSNRWTVFVARRTLRVFPLYYFWLIVLFWLVPVLAPGLLAVPEDVEPWCWTYSFNVFVWTHQSWPAEHTLNHFWSLAVEEQFYLLWPLVVFSVPARRLGEVCLLGIGLAIGLKVGLFAQSSTAWPAIYTAAFCRMDALLGGGLIAWCVRFPEAKEIRTAFRTLSIVLLAMLCWVFSHRSLYFVAVFDRFSASLLTSFYALLFPWLLSYLVEKPPGSVHRFLCWKPFAFIAKLSYGMYISHFLIWSALMGGGLDWLMTLQQTTGVAFWLLAFVCTTLLTVGISWVLYTILESPLLGLKRFFPYETRPEPAVAPAYQSSLVVKND